MTAKRIYFILLIVISLLQGCANDNKKTSRESPPGSAAAPAPARQEPSASAEQLQGTQENKESTAGKSAEQLRENKKNRLGTIPTGKDAELNSTIPAPPIKATGKSSNRPGPAGYVTKKDLALQADPAPNAAKITTLKQYETVYILETKMTDENGNLSQYPTWYKVERENKERGWVVANGINAGAGG